MAGESQPAAESAIRHETTKDRLVVDMEFLWSRGAGGLHGSSRAYIAPVLPHGRAPIAVRSQTPAGRGSGTSIA